MKIYEEIIKSSLDQETLEKSFHWHTLDKCNFELCKFENYKLQACTVLWIQAPFDVTMLLSADPS